MFVDDLDLKILKRLRAMEAEVLGVATTESEGPKSVLTYERLEQSIRDLDPDGRRLAEAALLSRLRKHPVDFTKTLAKMVPERLAKEE